MYGRQIYDIRRERHFGILSLRLFVHQEEEKRW